ncbi:type II toxin-antitoxin system antitoxin SocA domain-containing protein [Clostridium sp.]|uniref:type II toxin-antitoxin system antitoxin SocA domain-containing protein n=1 Tax=Clostridium sp. TaxID=1506 RepID=UPI003217652D
MSDKYDFCEVCLDDTSYTVTVEEVTEVIRGYSIKYKRKEAICNICGSYIDIPEINDENLEELYGKIRVVDNIISIDEIQKIIDKYDIKKRPLSKLLGWGETTITRYLDGSLPTREYSDKLKLILNNVNEMEKLLENNKSSITEVTYRKCNEAIGRIKSDEKAITINEEKTDEEKIFIVTKYLISKCGDITPLALQKLLYYCQAFCKIFSGEYLFENDCQAWVHGPVFVDVYNKYSIFGRNVIDVIVDEINLDNQDEEEVVECVAKYFGRYSGRTLEEMTHMERPWRETRRGLKKTESSNRIIDKKLIDSYFNSEKVKYNMINVADITEYISDLLEKI